ncbi:indigoidine synthase IndC [Vogesella sp. LIG4]|uniref:indigoidine synthase IndC n=1 Tax=Vogesella sp. LIG4 TaxID=1192162 RepID=UPI00082013C4|nr:indigoidine synthase IndC [Vogesella sp. LIG4]SCK27823.1 4-oxalocrotonate tautomerase [Vogesella sp. LIG4]
MPHVVIHCFKADIPAANLERIQQSLTQLLQQELSCLTGAVSVDLQPVEPALWQQQVYETLIVPRMTDLLRRPDYTY